MRKNYNVQVRYVLHTIIWIFKKKDAPRNTSLFNLTQQEKLCIRERVKRTHILSTFMNHRVKNPQKKPYMINPKRVQWKKGVTHNCKHKKIPFYSPVFYTHWSVQKKLKGKRVEDTLHMIDKKVLAFFYHLSISSADHFFYI